MKDLSTFLVVVLVVLLAMLPFFVAYFFGLCFGILVLVVLLTLIGCLVFRSDDETLVEKFFNFVTFSFLLILLNLSLAYSNVRYEYVKVKNEIYKVCKFNKTELCREKIKILKADKMKANKSN